MQTRSRYQDLLDSLPDDLASLIQERRYIGGTDRSPRVLRLFFADRSYLDIRFAGDDYVFHWERRVIDGTLFRWDNAPHHPSADTFPHHLHERTEENVVASQLPYESIVASLIAVLRFIQVVLDGPES